MLSAFNHLKENQIPILLWVLVAKLLYTGLTLSDCLGALVILASMLLSKIVTYLYPKRPDLYHELSLIQQELKVLTSKSDDLGHDVAGLKFGLSQKR